MVWQAARSMRSAAADHVQHERIPHGPCAGDMAAAGPGMRQLRPGPEAAAWRLGNSRQAASCGLGGAVVVGWLRPQCGLHKT